MSDKGHRRPPPGWHGGGPPPGSPSVQPGEFWRQLGDVTTKVSANAKELWLDPVKEIVRDIGGDVKEAFRPGGAADAHAALRATAAERRARAPPVAQRPAPAAASSVIHRAHAGASSSHPADLHTHDDATGAAGGFRGGIGWEPARGAAAKQLDSIFASLGDPRRDDADPDDPDDDDDADAVSASERPKSSPGARGDVETGDANADAEISLTSEAALRDETAEAFAKLSAMRSTGGGAWGDLDDFDLRRGGVEGDWIAGGGFMPEPLRRVARAAAKGPMTTLAVAIVAAIVVVGVLVRDHASTRLVEATTVGLEATTAQSEATTAESSPPEEVVMGRKLLAVRVRPGGW